MKYKIPIFLVIYLCLILAGCNSEERLSFEEYISKAKMCVEKGDIDNAVKFYKKAELIRPNEVITHLALGALYDKIWTKNYEEAYSNYKEELSRGVKSSLNLNEELKKRGLKLEYRNMALNEYQETVRIDPSNLEARNYLGLYYLNNKEYARSINEYNAMLQHGNKSSLVYWHLSDAYLGAGEYNHAIESIEDAYRIERNLDYYRFRLGKVYFKMKNYEKAFQILTTLKKSNSPYYDSLVDFKISNHM